MTHTEQCRAQYRALIVMGRAWREAYQQLRACGWDRAAALELANITVGVQVP